MNWINQENNLEVEESHFRILYLVLVQCTNGTFGTLDSSQPLAGYSLNMNSDHISKEKALKNFRGAQKLLGGPRKLHRGHQNIL